MDRYIPVVEVDNKRAAAAYKKALEDFDRALPELVEFADQYDEVLAERDRQLDKKYPTLHAWRRLSGSTRSDLETIRLGLEADYRLASVAVAPYRLPDHEAIQITKWEDGTEIARLKQMAEVRKRAVSK